jgi:hypothetical protein
MSRRTILPLTFIDWLLMATATPALPGSGGAADLLSRAGVAKARPVMSGNPAIGRGTASNTPGACVVRSSPGAGWVGGPARLVMGRRRLAAMSAQCDRITASPFAKTTPINIGV